MNILGVVFANISAKRGNYYYSNKYKYYYQNYYGKDTAPDGSKAPEEAEEDKEN